MVKIKYSKRASPLQFKKSVCVILPRVDINEFLRERRRRSLSGAPPPTLDGPSKQVHSRPKRRLRVKNEPPCQFHSEADINDDRIEEVCGVLGEPRNAVSCVHDITRTMCYMCSPVAEVKAEIWNEIPRWQTPAINPPRTWHTPAVVPSTSASSASTIVDPLATNEQEESALVDSPVVDVGVETEEQIFIARNSSPVDQSTQTARHYPCKYCPALFSDLMHLMHHKTVHQKMLECVFCSAHFVTKNDLKSHMKLHMMPKHFECVYCTQVFRKKHDIKTHLALHAEQKLFHCLSCPAIFTQKNLLRHHEKSHSVSKFVHFFKRINDETVVESRFPSDSTNESRISSDSANVLVQLTPNPSSESNTSISDFQSIPQEHFQEEPPILEPHERFVNARSSIVDLNFFKCETCPLSFKSFALYKTHHKCHTRKDGKFVCTYCEGRFKRKSGLIKHTTAGHTVC